jgi:hypothetical protein
MPGTARMARMRESGPASLRTVAAITNQEISSPRPPLRGAGQQRCWLGSPGPLWRAWGASSLRTATAHTMQEISSPSRYTAADQERTRWRTKRQSQAH